MFCQTYDCKNKTNFRKRLECLEKSKGKMTGMSVCLLRQKIWLHQCPSRDRPQLPSQMHTQQRIKENVGMTFIFNVLGARGS